MRRVRVPYVEPRAEILEVLQEGEVSRVVIRFDRIDDGLQGPGGLYEDPRSGDPRFQLHKLVRQDGSVCTFETYDAQHPLPKPGEVYSWRASWTPRAMEAALDTATEWTRTVYPDNGDHDHCLFTWETIAAGAENREGYHSAYGWITVDAYNRFIRDDIYRLRRAGAAPEEAS